MLDRARPPRLVSPTLAASPLTDGPVTGTGTASRNVDGQAIAITVFSAVKWWGRGFLPALFLYARLYPARMRTLSELSFIHFARWNLIRELPYNGPPQRKGKFKHPQLFFESNFNGGWEEYIDAFSHILTRGMNLFWGSSYGFPKPLPTGPFKEYIKRHEVEASHFHSAYPEATTTIINSALKLDSELQEFKRRTQGLDDDDFAREWDLFLTKVQRWV